MTGYNSERNPGCVYVGGRVANLRDGAGSGCKDELPEKGTRTLPVDPGPPLFGLPAAS